MSAADEEHDTPPICASLPIITGGDGQPYMGCDAVVALLRAIAAGCRENADDPGFDLDTLAAILDIEADTLDVRAIEHTA